MRFLTRAWHSGELSDSDHEAAAAAYRAHRATVLPRLPETARWFAETVDIHDGLLRAVTLDREAATLQLRLRCGDLERGYFDLELTYSGVRVDRLDVPVLRTIAASEPPEALYLEEDVIEAGWYVHRWLWWPFRRELDVEFADLTFQREPRAAREFERSASSYAERPTVLLSN